MNKRILLSFGMLVVAGAVIAGGTGAFFSDTETSAGNVFTAGSVSINLLDVGHVYGGDTDNAPVFNWMGGQGRFTLDDLKPLDTGLLDINLENGANEAHVCAMIVGDPTNNLGSASLALYDQLNFFIDGEGTQVTPGEWFDLGEVAPNSPVGTGVDYCFGESNVDGTGLVSCDYGDGTIDYNAAQNGSFAADLMFYAVQTRNNENFSCDQLTTDVDGNPVYTPAGQPPVVTSVTPASGEWSGTGSFVLGVDAADADGDLEKLEIDTLNSPANILDFTVYADQANPYGTANAAQVSLFGGGLSVGDSLAATYITNGVTVAYNPSNEKWSIEFDNNMANALFQNGDRTFYIVVHDQNGNTWGSMYGSAYAPDSPDSYGDYLGSKNTFTFTDSQ